MCDPLKLYGYPITHLGRSDGVRSGIEVDEDVEEDSSAYHRDHHRVLGWWYVLEGRRTEATHVHARHSHALTISGTWHPSFHDLFSARFLLLPLTDSSTSVLPLFYVPVRFTVSLDSKLRTTTRVVACKRRPRRKGRKCMSNRGNCRRATGTCSPAGAACLGSMADSPLHSTLLFFAIRKFRWFEMRREPCFIDLSLVKSSKHGGPSSPRLQGDAHLQILNVSN